MRLVNRDEADTHLLNLCYEKRRRQTFWRNIQEFYTTIDRIIKHLKDFRMTHARIDDRCKDSSITKMLHLILHQSYKRSDDKTHTFHGKSRNLKRNTLTATRRHQSKSIMTGTYALNNLFLDSPKRGETEILSKNGKVVHSKTNRAAPNPDPSPARGKRVDSFNPTKKFPLR